MPKRSRFLPFPCIWELKHLATFKSFVIFGQPKRRQYCIIRILHHFQSICLYPHRMGKSCGCRQKEPILDHFQKFMIETPMATCTHHACTHSHTYASTQESSSWSDFTERTMHILLEIYFISINRCWSRATRTKKGLYTVHWIWWNTLPFGWTQVDDGIDNTLAREVAMFAACRKRFGHISSLPHRNPIRTVNYCQ